MMVMYGMYNSETLEKLSHTVHKIHNTTTWNEKLFASELSALYNLYLSKDGISNYATNSLLNLRTLREKYIHMYKTLSASYTCMERQ